MCWKKIPVRQVYEQIGPDIEVVEASDGFGWALAVLTGNAPNDGFASSLVKFVSTREISYSTTEQRTNPSDRTLLLVQPNQNRIVISVAIYISSDGTTIVVGVAYVDGNDTASGICSDIFVILSI